MRPTLNVLSEDLIARILGEAKRILAETGIEVRGEALRAILIEHGLKNVGMYHAKRPLVRNKEGDLTTQDLNC